MAVEIRGSMFEVLGSKKGRPAKFEVNTVESTPKGQRMVRSLRFEVKNRESRFGPRTGNLEPGKSVKPSRLIMSAKIVDKPEDHFFRLACFLIHLVKLGVRNILLVFGNVKMTL